jgi:hypothetical protein
VVLRARDTKLLRVVAIKALAPRLAASGTARRRFVREAQAAAAVRDDHVVAIHAVSEDGPVPYLVMEYISGITLQDRVRQGKALELKEVLRIGMQVAAGLAAAHAQGVVHRDIKPANIVLENSVQRVKITDFGLARAADPARGQAGGVLAGTPLYMSPEQARGEPTDHRTDLFSLGSLLYTLCAGRSPFQADTTAAVLKCVCEDMPVPLREINPDVPEWLSDVISKLHAKDAGGRWASAREVASLLSERLALLQQPPRTVPPAALPVKSRRLVIAACVVGLLLALVALAAFLMWQPRAADPDPGGAIPRESSGPVEPLELRRENIPPLLLALAGGGDPARAPPELAAVLGDGRFLLPRAGQTSWMAQSPDGKVLGVPLDEDVALFDVPAGNLSAEFEGTGRPGHLGDVQPRRTDAGSNHPGGGGGRRRAGVGPECQPGAVHEPATRSQGIGYRGFQRRREATPHRRGGTAFRLGCPLRPGNPGPRDPAGRHRLDGLQPGRAAPGRGHVLWQKRESL